MFDPNATYVLSGGMGGLGRSAARWMVSRGARHLLFLSRSGTSSAAARELISELDAQGVFALAPGCDVANKALLEQTLRTAHREMPPIKGCIQGSMVLKVSPREYFFSMEDISKTY